MRLYEKIEAYYNRRSDDDRQWGPALSWRPTTPDRPMHRKTTLRLFLFNLPFYFLGLLCVGLILAWLAQAADPSPMSDDALPLLYTHFGPITLVAAVAALLLDALACYLVIASWNRRAARLRMIDDLRHKATPRSTRTSADATTRTAQSPTHWWTAADRSPARPVTTDTEVPMQMQRQR